MSNSVNIKPKICSKCGKEFVPDSNRRMHCPECRARAKQEANQRKMNESKGVRIKPKKVSKKKRAVNADIVDVAIKARENGMTYG